ncbi:MAG: glutathione S-transferase family protein [Myxococcales bacterium]
MKLVIGNKNYSSWSLRPWLMLKHAGVPFEEQLIPFEQPDTAARIAQVSPSGRVPVLIDGAVVVWDSLAIGEYLHEKVSQARLWPLDPAARAVARSVSAEMHSGFADLRNHLPMRMRSVDKPRALLPGVSANVARITTLWADCRARFGAKAGGPFLFGAFTIADAMYAPVVSRFRTYGVELAGPARDYAAAIWALPSLQEWFAAAQKETYSAPQHERDAAAP